MKNNEIEKLAKILANVHGSCLQNFYQKSKSKFWTTLEEKTDNPEHVDKEFFRNISKYVFDLMNDYKDENLYTNKIERLAKIISEIHSKELLNFYDEIEGDFWDELIEKTENIGDVDKEFFRDIAKYILANIKKL